ncbi:MAG: hypothetical protein Q9159_002858 [Coniocarpon cinnabarinum]
MNCRHKEAQEKIIRALLEHGADSNMRLYYQQVEVLRAAVASGDAASVSVLLESGLGKYTRWDALQACEIVAEENGHCEIKEILAKHNRKMRGHKQTLGETLVSFRDSIQSQGDLTREHNLFKARLQHQQQIATKLRNKRLFQKMDTKVEMVEQADIDANPLVGACKTQRPVILRLILEAGASLPTDLEEMRKVLSAAMPSIKILRLLAEHGFDPTKLGTFGLCLAADHGSTTLMDYMLSVGVPVDPAAKGVSVEDDPNNSSPLISATMNGAPHTVRHPLDNGASPNVMSAAFGSALHAVCVSEQPHDHKCDIARLLLEAGAIPTVTHCAFGSPLHVATSEECIELAKMFIRRGASVHDMTPMIEDSSLRQRSGLVEVANQGSKPLHIGLRRANVGMVRMLIREGASPLASTETGESSIGCLLNGLWSGESLRRRDEAAKTQEVLTLLHILIEEGASILQDCGGFFPKPLHAAVSLQEVEILDFVLKQGVNVNECLTSFGSALRLAAERKWYRGMDLLLAYGANVNISISEGEELPPLFTAVTANWTRGIRRLLEADARVDPEPFDQSHALRLAATRHNAEAVKLFLEAGCDVGGRSGCGRAPLEEALMKGLLDDQARRETVHILLDHGADVSSMPGQTDAPLMLASHVRDLELVEDFLLRGAKPLTGDPERCCALCDVLQDLDLLSARRLSGHERVVSRDEMNRIATDGLKIAKTLLAHGADINHDSQHAHCPLFSSFQLRRHGKEMAKELLRRGAIPDFISARDRRCLNRVNLALSNFHLPSVLELNVKSSSITTFTTMARLHDKPVVRLPVMDGRAHSASDDPPVPPSEIPIEEEDYRFKNVNLWSEWAEQYCPGGFHPIAIGQVVEDGHHHRYRIVRKLGWASFSTVWLGLDEVLSRLVALKISVADAPNTASKEGLTYLSIRNDMQTQGKASSYITNLLGHFELEGPNGKHACLVLEVMGPPCSEFLRNPQDFPGFPSGNKPFRPPRLPMWMARRIIKGLVSGLHALHRRGFVHSDLHLGNLLLQPLRLDTSHKAALEQEGNLHDKHNCVLLERKDGKVDKWAPKYLHESQPLVEWTDLSHEGMGVKLSDLGNQPISIFPFGPPDEVKPDEDLDDAMLQFVGRLGDLPPEVYTSKWPSFSCYFDPQGNKIRNSVEDPFCTPPPPDQIHNLPTIEEGLLGGRSDDLSDEEAHMVLTLLRKIFQWLPEARPSIAEILEDPWVKSLR